MAVKDDRRAEALRRAQQCVEEIVTDPSRLAEVKADEAAVLNGHCPEADPADFIEHRLKNLPA